MTGLYCRCGCKVCRVPDTRHCGGLPNCGVPRVRGRASLAVPAHERSRAVVAPDTGRRPGAGVPGAGFPPREGPPTRESLLT